MTWFADLAPLTYFTRQPGSLRAIGWLNANHGYAKGPVAEEDFARLCELLVDPWEPGGFTGSHACDLCRFTSGPTNVHFRKSSVSVGHANLFLPAGDVLFVAPSLVVHYIDAHEYQPPPVFWEAVRACPPMRSLAYKKALLAAGGGALLEHEAREGPVPSRWSERPKNVRLPPGALEAPRPATWRVMRIDDNGNQFEVARFATEREADDAAMRFEARGHKQSYWVEGVG